MPRFEIKVVPKAIGKGLLNNVNLPAISTLQFHLSTMLYKNTLTPAAIAVLRNLTFVLSVPILQDKTWQNIHN